MKFKIVSLLACSTLLIANSSFAKNKDLIRANYYYAHSKFHEAIPYFEKIADDENDPEIYAELGDCYRFTSNIQKANEYYAKAVSLQGVKDAVVLHYGQSLMQEMKYDSAKKILLDYQSRNMGEKRVANLIAGCTNAKEVLNAKPKGDITFMNLNTNGSEYAPTIWKNNLVFTADFVLDDEKSKNKIKGFTFNRIYSVPCDKDGNCGKDFNQLNVTGVGTKEHMGPATFSQDGKKMFYTVTKSDATSSGAQPSTRAIVDVPLEIMMAKDFDTSSGEFQTNVPFKYNSKKYSVAHPTVSPDGKVLMFTSDMPGGKGGNDIYFSKRGEDNDWTKPVNAGDMINTEGEEMFPYFASNNTVYFSSDGQEGIGGLDVYMTKFDESTNTFTKPINLGTPINSSYDDMSMALYADGRSSYFSSNRPALKGGDNIYFFNRTHAYLHIKLFDDVTNNPLNVANVVLENNGEKTYVGVDMYGEFIAPVYNDIPYKLSIGKNGYISKSLTVNTSSFKDNDTVTQMITLTSTNIQKAPEPVKETVLVKNEPPVVVRDSSYYKKPSYLIMTIIDSSNKKPLKNAVLSIESERDTREITANEKGKLLTQLLPEIKYAFHVGKTGYVTKEITLKTIFAKEEPDTFTEKVALVKEKVVKQKKVKPTVTHEATTDAEEERVVTDKPAKKKTVKEKIVKEKKPIAKAAEPAKEEPKEEAKQEEPKKQPSTLVKGRTYNLDGYYAEYNKSEIVESRKHILDSLVVMMNENPTMKIRVLGHADCRGSAAYNMKLSTERAIAVGKYLVSKGIDPKRLEHKGLGVTKPVVQCPVCNECSEEQHEKNRGFEYVVIHK